MCGQRDNCALSEDGTRAFCRRVKSDRPGRGGWTHILSDTPRPFTSSPPIPKPPDARAPLEHRDAIYCKVIRQFLSLSDARRRSLRARGLSDAEIGRCGFADTPDERQGQQIADALSIYGLEGVPGFYREGGRWRMVRVARPGFFVPYRSTTRQIQALQYRLDESLGKTKYVWLSSRDRDGGASSGSPVNYANNHLLREASEVCITEGGLKASVIAHLTDAPVIGVAGVSCFGADFAANLRAEFPNLKRVVVAYDADWRQNEAVSGALFRLMDELQAARFQVRARTWPAHLGKGLDDYLLAQQNGAEVQAA